MTPALLLAAGYGTRMGELGARTPKALLEVGGRPVVDHLLERLAELPGLGPLHLVTNARHHRAFAAWADRRGEAPPGRVTVHDDGTDSPESRLGAVGDLDFVLKRAEAEGGALVAACDNVLRFSLRPFWDAFRGGGSWVLALGETDPEKLRRTGVLELDDGGRLLALHEKPAAPPSTWACPPLYLLDAAALAAVGPYLAAGGSSDEIGRFVAFLAARLPVHALRTAGERLDVGSPESWRRADEVLRAGGRSNRG